MSNKSIYKELNLTLKNDGKDTIEKLGLDADFKRVRKYFNNIANVENAVNGLLIYNELDSEDKLKSYYNRIIKERPKNVIFDSDYLKELTQDFYNTLDFKYFKYLLDERDKNYKRILEDIKADTTKYKKLVNLVTSTYALKGTKGIIKNYLLEPEEIKATSYAYFKRDDELEPDIKCLDVLFIDLEYYERLFIKLSLNYINDYFKVNQDLLTGDTEKIQSYFDTYARYTFFCIFNANILYKKIKVNMSVINIATLEIRNDKELEEERNKYKVDYIPLHLGQDSTFSYVDSPEMNANALVSIKHSIPSNTELTPKLLEQLDIETKGDIQAFNLDYELVKKDELGAKLDDLDDFVLNTICFNLFLDKGLTVFNDRHIAKAWTRETGHENAKQPIIDKINDSIEKLSSTTFNYYLESKQSRDGLKIAKQRRSGKYINVNVIELERLLTDEELKNQVSDNELNDSKYYKTVWYQLTGGNYLNYLKDTEIKPNRPDRALLYGNINHIDKGYKDQLLKTHIIKAIDRAYMNNEPVLALNLDSLCKVYGYDFTKKVKLTATDRKTRQRIKDRAEEILNDKKIVTKYKLKKYIDDDDIKEEREKLTQYVQELTATDNNKKVTSLLIEFNR